MAWRFALGAVLVFSCFWLVLPVVFLVALLVALIAVLATANSLGHVGGFDAGVYAVGLRLALFVLLPGLLVGAHRLLRGGSMQGFRRWLPTTPDAAELVLALLALLVVTCVAAAAEWDHTAWLPDEIATTTILASLLAFGVGVPAAMLAITLAAHWKVFRWSVPSARRTKWLTVCLSTAVVSVNFAACGVSPGATRTAQAIDPRPLPAPMREDVQRASTATSVTEWSRWMLQAIAVAPTEPVRPPSPTVGPAPQAHPAPTVRTGARARPTHGHDGHGSGSCQVGPQGPTGPNGAAGQPGANGMPGATGPAGPSGPLG